MNNTDDLRLRQSTWPAFDIDGVPGTTSADSATEMVPAIIDALGSGGTLPDTANAGTAGATSDTTGTVTTGENIDPPLIPPVTIPQVVIQAPDFTGAVTDVLAANPNLYLGTPSQPSVPLLTPIPAGILIAWDGYNADGTLEKTPDWDRLEVHVSEDSSFTPSLTTLKATIHALKEGQVGQAVYATTRYGVNQYVRFVAVARSGASSVASKPGVGQPAQISTVDVGTDVFTAIAEKDTRHHIF